jgi:hypothetical protein
MQEANEKSVLGNFDNASLTHFGVEPLQQYLIPFPGGRYQAFYIAWDSRPNNQGGQSR